MDSFCGCCCCFCGDRDRAGGGAIGIAHTHTRTHAHSRTLTHTLTHTRARNHTHSLTPTHARTRTRAQQSAVWSAKISGWPHMRARFGRRVAGIILRQMSLRMAVGIGGGESWLCLTTFHSPNRRSCVKYSRKQRSISRMYRLSSRKPKHERWWLGSVAAGWGGAPVCVCGEQRCRNGAADMHSISMTS